MIVEIHFWVRGRSGFYGNGQCRFDRTIYGNEKLKNRMRRRKLGRLVRIWKECIEMR